MHLLSQTRFQFNFREHFKYAIKFPGSVLANYPSWGCSYEVNFNKVPKQCNINGWLDNSALWNSDDLTPTLITSGILIENINSILDKHKFRNKLKTKKQRPLVSTSAHFLLRDRCRYQICSGLQVKSRIRSVSAVHPLSDNVIAWFTLTSRNYCVMLK